MVRNRQHLALTGARRSTARDPGHSLPEQPPALPVSAPSAVGASLAVDPVVAVVAEILDSAADTLERAVEAIRKDATVLREIAGG